MLLYTNLINDEKPCLQAPYKRVFAASVIGLPLEVGRSSELDVYISCFQFATSR